MHKRSDFAPLTLYGWFNATASASLRPPQSARRHQVAQAHSAEHLESALTSRHRVSVCISRLQPEKLKQQEDKLRNAEGCQSLQKFNIYFFVVFLSLLSFFLSLSLSIPLFFHIYIYISLSLSLSLSLSISLYLSLSLYVPHLFPSIFLGKLVQ